MKANRLGMYADVRAVLDSALNHGGGEFECATHGDAVHWRQRAYKFRKLYAETLGPKASSPYDILMMPRLTEGSGVVRILIRQTTGVFRPAGEAIPVHVEDEEVLSFAKDLAKKLEGE